MLLIAKHQVASYVEDQLGNDLVLLLGIIVKL